MFHPLSIYPRLPSMQLSVYLSILPYQYSPLSYYTRKTFQILQKTTNRSTPPPLSSIHVARFSPLLLERVRKTQRK